MSEVVWSREALAALEKLDWRTADRIRSAVQRFASERRGDLKKLRGVENTWRLRVGDWRVILEITAGRIAVLRVVPRQSAYRD